MDPTPRRHPWVYALLEGLLEGDEGTRSLLRKDPFDGAAPTWVRIRRCQYRFTTPAERSRTGDWWHVEPVGTYVEPVRLEMLRGDSGSRLAGVVGR